MQTTALLASFAVAFGRSAVPAASGALRPTRGAGASLMRLSGGASNEPSDALLQATYACNQLSAATLADAQGEVAALRKSVAGGEAVPTFGAKADELVADALDKFEAESPKGDADVTSLYATRAEELRGAIVGSLEPVFVQQICLLKDAAMEQFKKGLLGDGDGSEALAAAEAAFVREAGASVPGKTGWGFKLERQSLVSAMQAILAEQKKAQSAKLQTAQQMQTALSYLQACNTLLPAPLRFFCPPHSRSLLVPPPHATSLASCSRPPRGSPPARAVRRCSSSRCRPCRRSTPEARVASGTSAPHTARRTPTSTCRRHTSRAGATCRSRWCPTRAPTCSAPTASPTVSARPTSASPSRSTSEKATLADEQESGRSASEGEVLLPVLRAAPAHSCGRQFGRA